MKNGGIFPRCISFAFLALVASLASLAEAVPLTLVIDPAHGGEDRGAVTSDGTEEKTLTLQWALRLRERLAQESDLVVVMTRDQDVTVSRDQRAAIANQAKAHVFLSVHMNQAPSSAPAGTVLRVYRPANPPKRSGGSAPVTWWTAQSGFAVKSRAVASECFAALSRVGAVTVREGPWIDLRSVMGPAIAIDLGYLSAPDDLAKQRDPAWQTQWMGELVSALKGFKDR